VLRHSLLATLGKNLADIGRIGAARSSLREQQSCMPLFYLQL
jgi:hypothetical protein